MSGAHINCGYCGQWVKESNCGYYKGISVHNIPNCNCLKAAIDADFFVAPRETRR